MSGSNVVVGVYTYLDDVLNAVEKIKEAELDYRVFSPVARHEIEEVTFPEKSNVRRFTLTGGILGCTFGFGLAILCSLDWPMRVSSKPIVSIPAFFPVGYECTILFAALATMLGILHFCRLPDLLRKVGYDPRFSEDKFGLVVGSTHEQLDEIQQFLKESGADEVDVREAL
ncbi:MAG: DUF3341 domain-containing protein [Deltaproteobacteria bacterium]|nr:DUF3341 domain-containing protein [Deltaproteobacteria bacterium]